MTTGEPKRRARAAVAIVAAVASFVALPSVASAGVTFGADMSQPVHTGAGDCSTPLPGACAFVTLTSTSGTPEPTAPVSGVLTRVSVRSVNVSASTIDVNVLRPGPDTGSPGLFDFHGVGAGIPVPVSADPSPPGNITSISTRHPIAAGDRLGLQYASDVAYASAYSASAVCGFTLAAQPADADANYDITGCNLEMLVSGTIEPDADGDGYGDETQDACPTDAATQGPCPAPPPSKKCKRKKAKHRAGAAKKKRCKKKRKR